VDRATDEFMEAARVEGLKKRPKVDVSRSAALRLVLRRVTDNMSPVEVKTLLDNQAVRAGPETPIGPRRYPPTALSSRT
jgi:hypothetical protein